MAKEPFLSGLNPRQKEAVTFDDSPLLVVAGAGSGKTNVIMHKYAYLVSKKNLKPPSIISLTSTTRAAKEMRERIKTLVPCDMDKNRIGTFHALGNGILRNEIEALGYKNDFVIYDTYDGCSLIRHILKELKVYEALYKGVASRISALKASLLTPEAFVASGDSFGFDEKLARIYMRYQYELKRSNALDVDDLIMMSVRLFDENPKALGRYKKSFDYILVDDFQDTNPAQYALITKLVSKKLGFCAVADDDQNIYRSKGAAVENIYNMEKDFRNLKIIHLEQNYRSTQNILNVSGSVISKNPVRKDKKLWTERDEGDKVHHYWFGNENEEAKYIAKLIKEMYLKGTFAYRDITIFYRVGIQARSIAEVLKSERIPYKIVDGSNFYQKKEIKDTLAYLRLCVNPHDNVSLRRVINYPSRGIGVATINKIESEAKKHDKSLYEAIKNICDAKGVSASVKEKLGGFLRIIEDIDKDKFDTATDMLKRIIAEVGYIDSLDDEEVENIYELVSSAGGASVDEFLDGISLITNLDEAVRANVVSLMTLHNAKGLEFPVVFITGVEEGILPYFKAAESDDEMCEERRLFYVGMTRAKDMLYLTGAAERRLYSKVQGQEPSRFLSEIPLDCCKMIAKCKADGVVKDDTVKKVKKITLSSKYKSGCRVKHPKWGLGVVRDCYGEGDDLKVMVNFPSVGIKRLALKFAQLERI